MGTIVPLALDESVGLLKPIKLYGRYGGLSPFIMLTKTEFE